MRNRYRVEIYDDNKANDLTLYFSEGVNREHLSELVFSNLARFSGTIRAYVYDNKRKQKVLQIFIPNHVVDKYKITKLTKYELGFI